jgi:hypothetical protein
MDLKLNNIDSAKTLTAKLPSVPNLGQHNFVNHGFVIELAKGATKN